jgi:hypothetical protein
VLRMPVIVCVTVAALAAPTAASAGGVFPSADPAGGSLLSPGKTVRYQVAPGTDTTEVRAWRRKDGKLLWSRVLDGVYGTTRVTTRGASAGLSPNGSLLVLASFSRQAPAAASRFALVPTTPSQQVHTLRLDGDWGFDALSADARTLYLIQRLGSVSTLRYNVRAVDLGTLKLVPGVIAAKGPGSATEQMAGIPVGRIAGPGARWVYTLYGTTAGGAFIHALDTATRRAVCIDLPWRNVSDQLARVRMAIPAGSPALKLRVLGRSAPVASIDLTTLAVTADPRLPADV